MIIVCPSCGKNFNVRDDQIPDKGRLLQCSNCKHEWFYNKNTIPIDDNLDDCLLYTSPSPRDRSISRMPSSA